jgi:murein L,D-transpeptidase YcbB/YkuD
MTFSPRLRPLLPGTVGALVAAALAAGAWAQTPALDPQAVKPADPAPTTTYRTPPPAPPLPMPALRREQVERLLAELDGAPSHGFDEADFRTEDIRGLLQSGDPRGQSELIAATIRYARAMRGQRIDPLSVSTNWSVKPAPFDAHNELATALQQNRLDAWLASLPPPYGGYQALRGALVRYREVAEAGGWGRVPEGPAIRPGGSDARVPALRRRLAAEGYVVGSGTGPVYDKALVDAVKRFQLRRGLGSDGIVAAGTLRELNVSAEKRVAQIEANLERWRWLPRRLPASRIEVNLPTAMLDLYRGSDIPSTMRVVVGSPKHNTPMMTAEVQAVTFNPPWNVPLSIVKNEIAPRLARDPGYLAREQLRVVGKYANGLPMLQQAAGPKSALGRVKFESPNEFAVFLHDTPSRGGFSRAERLLSHGCVRLERPLELAELLLEGDPEWPRSRMEQAIASGKTVRVALPEPIPMYLLYWTAFVDPQGGVNFREDIYDWDARLVAALDQSRSLAAAKDILGS